MLLILCIKVPIEISAVISPLSTGPTNRPIPRSFLSLSPSDLQFLCSKVFDIRVCTRFPKLLEFFTPWFGLRTEILVCNREMAGQNVDLFDAYFRRADLDRDGRISGNEAVSFFQGSNLPKPVLAQVLLNTPCFLVSIQLGLLMWMPSSDIKGILNFAFGFQFIGIHYVFSDFITIIFTLVLSTPLGLILYGLLSGFNCGLCL